MSLGSPLFLIALLGFALAAGFVLGRGSHAASAPAGPPPPAPVPGQDPGLEDLLRAGKKLEAIKYFRERNRCGLKDAKDAVDALERALKG